MAAMPGLPPCHLVYIGGGRLLAPLKGMAAARGLGGCVHFLPTVPLAELLAWTASADIGVQPIRNTCLNHLSTDSNKLFEYAMAGLPVVASDFPEIRRVVEAHDIGLLFDPETPGELAGALGRLIADGDLARAARRQCARAPGRSAGRRRRASSSAYTSGCLPGPRSGGGGRRRRSGRSTKGRGGREGAAGGLLQPESEPARP